MLSQRNFRRSFFDNSDSGLSEFIVPFTSDGKRISERFEYTSNDAKNRKSSSNNSARESDTVIPFNPIVFNAADIAEINLSNSSLKAVPDLSLFGNLRMLILSGNKIARLESLPPTLEILDLSFNELQRVYLDDESKCTIFENLENLQILHVSHNHLEFLPTGTFKQCQWLTHLNLSHNSLVDASLCAFSSCIRLFELNLAQNQIARADSIKLLHEKNLPNLRILNLIGNPCEILCEDELKVVWSSLLEQVQELLLSTAVLASARGQQRTPPLKKKSSKNRHIFNSPGLLLTRAEEDNSSEVESGRRGESLQKRLFEHSVLREIEQAQSFSVPLPFAENFEENLLGSQRSDKTSINQQHHCSNESSRQLKNIEARQSELIYENPYYEETVNTEDEEPQQFATPETEIFCFNDEDENIDYNREGCENLENWKTEEEVQKSCENLNTEGEQALVQMQLYSRFLSKIIAKLCNQDSKPTKDFQKTLMQILDLCEFDEMAEEKLTDQEYLEEEVFKLTGLKGAVLDYDKENIPENEPHFQHFVADLSNLSDEEHNATAVFSKSLNKPEKAVIKRNVKGNLRYANDRTLDANTSFGRR